MVYAVAVGNYDNVHGWNPDFRDVQANGLAPRFHSFAWNNNGNRPDGFQSLVVAGPYTGNRALDHQGHIVPQNILNTVLSPIADLAYAARPNNLVALDNFLTQNYPQMNFGDITTYINNVLVANGAHPAIFVDTTGTDAEDYLGGYFSVIMWNPVNICRAPTDDRRGGAPGNTVDLQVINYMLNNVAAAGIQLLPGMITAFQRMPATPVPADTEAFIAACNQSLVNQQANATGYYQFPWQDEPSVANVLIPG
jgi:hypothetical protein